MKKEDSGWYSESSSAQFCILTYGFWNVNFLFECNLAERSDVYFQAFRLSQYSIKTVNHVSTFMKSPCWDVTSSGAKIPIANKAIKHIN
ncbi:MAG: hypothetical protein ACLSE4_08110 [Clostridium sp.]|nr:hypothetical protein [Clostridiaceae bacterium]